MEKIAIPDFLNHLPTYRGYPVPYFVPKDENGVYQLKYASQEKMNNCLKYHKCCVCFKPLQKGDYWFVSGPLGLQNQIDSHPPMHRYCAEYSLQICPHLFFEKTRRTTNEEMAHPSQVTEKPKRLFLINARKITVLKQLTIRLIQYKSYKVVSQYAYVDGRLSCIQ